MVMRKTLILAIFLLIIIATAGFLGKNNVEKAEVATVNVLETDNVKICERPAGGWELSLLVYDPRDGVAPPSGVDPESIKIMMNGVDITEEVKIKKVKEDPAYRLSINRYWAPGEYNITLVMADYEGNCAIYKYILIFS